MRANIFHGASALALLTMAGVAAASPGAGSGKIQYRATATFSDGTSSDRLYAVWRDADSDGDGIGDEVWLRVRCDKGGAVAAAFEYDVKAPRDVATGQASGKRQHKPFTITKVVDSSSPLFGKTGGGGGGGGGAIGGKVSWDLATGKGARSAGWNIKENKTARTTPGTTSYDIKKAEGVRDPAGSSSDASAGKGADRKTMAHDDWHEVVLAAGAPNLCD